MNVSRTLVAVALSLAANAATAGPCKDTARPEVSAPPFASTECRSRVPPGCVAPWGVNLCEVTGVRTAFAIPAMLAGEDLPAGLRWSPVIGWGTNARGGILPDFPLTYPDGYVTDHPDDPMADFIAKMRYLRIEVDPGTAHERVYEYCDPAELAKVMTIGDWWGPDGLWGFAAINPGQWVALVPRFPPLPEGAHELHLTWTLGALHCDGFPSTGGEPLSVEGGHCLPAGDFEFFPIVHPYDFTVAPRTR